MPTTLKKRSHEWIDARSLAMCRLIAEKIRREPELFQKVLATLHRWKKIKKPIPRALLEWENIIDHNSVEHVLEILLQNNDEGQRLRQSDPFVGIMTEAERLQILAEYEKIGV